MAFKKAEVKQAKARILVMGPANAGKTYSALVLATALCGEGGRIAMLDTERGRSEAYGKIFDFDVEHFLPPFSTKRYIEMMGGAFEHAKHPGVVVVDSMSMEWAGSGGALERVDRLTEQSNNKNAFSSGWRKVSPEHQLFMDAFVMAPTHIIGTVRTKTAYELVETDKGKKEPKRIGLQPVQRDDLEYNADVIFDLDQEKHTARLAKANAAYSQALAQALEDEGNMITPRLAQKLAAWLAEGIVVPPKLAPPSQPRPHDARVSPRPEARKEPEAERRGSAPQGNEARDTREMPSPAGGVVGDAASGSATNITDIAQVREQEAARETAQAVVQSLGGPLIAEPLRATILNAIDGRYDGNPAKEQIRALHDEAVRICGGNVMAKGIARHLWEQAGVSLKGDAPPPSWRQAREFLLSAEKRASEAKVTT